MRRLFTILGLVVLAMPTLRADDDPGIKQTISYVQKLQTSTGGFLTAVPKPNERVAVTLRATSAGVRALHYLGGAAPSGDAARKFVESCWDDAGGGFADLPGGKADLFSTAVGLMAVVELKMPREKYESASTKFLSDHAQGFEDIRIAVAGLESIQAKSPKTEAWTAEVRKLQNPDGTFGRGAGRARATGGAVVALLRMGNDVSHRDKILETLNEGQRLNGGFGKEENEVASDMETTYRVMRCYMMLKAQPTNVEGVRSFIAKCRNEDGGYGVAPGQPSTVNGTYFAAIMRYWLRNQESGSRGQGK